MNTLFDELPKRRHQMHANSLAAWRELEPGPMQARVLAQYDAPHTDREVAARLGFADLNHVRPRVTELIKAGALEQVGKIKENGRAVRLVKRKERVMSEMTLAEALALADHLAKHPTTDGSDIAVCLLAACVRELTDHRRIRHVDEWHEDRGPVVWWMIDRNDDGDLDIDVTHYGTPNDSNAPEAARGTP